MLVPLLVLFIAIPIIEIYFLIQVGSAIGVLPTILLVIATAVLGTALLRQQGMSTMRRYQENVRAGKVPAGEMLEGLALLVGGVFLLTPGFFTDALGFTLLLPPTRKGMIKWLMSKVKFQMAGMSQSHQSYRSHGRHPDGGNVYDGEFTDVDDRPKQGDRFPPQD